MVRVYATEWHDESKIYARYRGNSDDQKPTQGLITGSEFLECDTGRLFYYEEVSNRWYPSSNASKTPISDADVMLAPSPVYDGTTKTQVVSSVLMGATTLVEDTDYIVQNNTGVLPGTYTLLIIGIGDYAGVNTVDFEIEKASGSVTASPDELTLTEGGDAGASTITVVGDGAVSVESADTSVATVELDGTTVTVTPVAEGNATVTVTLADGDLYEGGTDTISVTVEAGD